MPLIVREIISAARDLHPSFDEQQTPNASALRYLSRYAGELHGKIAAIDRDILREDVTLAVPDPFEDGIELPANRQVIELATDGGAPIAVIAALTRNDFNAPRPAAWQVGNRLYLSGNAAGWRDVTTISIAHVPAAVRLTQLTDTLEIPDAAENAVVSNLALFMAMRGNVRPNATPIPVGDFGANARQAEQTYLDDVVLGLSGRTFVIRDVWRP